MNTNDYQNQLPVADFVSIDLEFADNMQNICQFGLAVVREGRVVECRTWNIQPPGNHYDRRQMEVHHMSPSDTAYSPTLSQVWPEIRPYLENEQLWAHNATSTENPVLDKNLRRNDIDDGPYTIYDSMRLFIRPDRAQWNSGNGLRPCLYAMGLCCENHHDAGADAEMCAQLIIAYQQGKVPDWQESDRLMAEYEAGKCSAKPMGDLFAGDLFGSSPTISDSSSGWTKYDESLDGTDMPDFRALNTADTNPIYGTAVVLTGFFHIARKPLREALKKMGAQLKPTVTKNVQLILVGERNAGPAKLAEWEALVHNGYNIARIDGDEELDRLLYDEALAPSDFSIPAPARKELNFTFKHFNDNHIKLSYPVNSIAGRELYFPPSGLMGRMDCFCQICGNLGAFGNWEYCPQVNLVVLPIASIEALKAKEKDEVIRAFEDFYNTQRSVTFKTEFVTERDILKFARERIVRSGDGVTGELYTKYLQSAGIDPEKDFKYGLEVMRKEVEKEKASSG